MDKKKKSPRKSTAPKITDLDAQQRRLAIIKQKQCDTIAFHIVSKMIDCRVEDDVFLQSLKYLNQCHYQDIVEERAISKLCGYPVCGNEIVDMPVKKFHISTKSNKVYDITDRKNYCSNFCYKAGVYIKEQMLTSPLWYRDREEVPKFHFLPRTEVGIPGQEIDQGILKLDVDEEKLDQNFTSIAQFTQDIINDIPDEVCNKVDIENNTQKPKQEQVLKTEETNKPIVEPVLEKSKPEIDDIIVKLYGPSLADILRENAEYFQNETDSKTDNNNTAINKSQEIRSDNKEITKKVENKIDNKSNKQLETKLVDKSKKSVNFEPQPSTSKSEPYKIGFNRTLINTSSNNPQKSKGILKKPTEKPAEQKRVSFSKENSIQEIENLAEAESDQNRTFKKPEAAKPEETGKRFKNVNVIGMVQERSTIFSSKTAEKPLTVTEDIKNNDEPPLAHNQDSDKLKTNQTEEIPQEQQDTTKESRLSRLKNSSTFKKALTSKVYTPKSPNQDLKTKLDKCLTEWFTFDSILFLYGEDQVKKLISENSFKLYLNKKKDLELDDRKQKQYVEICKRLNLMDLADQKFDETVTGKKRRPLPRYEELRQSVENSELRVQAFYGGCYEMHEEEVDTDTESVKDEEENVKGTPAVLPLVDNKDIMATRKKIFQTSISRSISTICEILQDSPNRLLAEIKHLVNTFEFTASNIVFKTSEWPFVTLLLIKILSIRDAELQRSFKSNEINDYFISLINQLNFTEKYIESLLNKAQIQNLLEVCMKKDCEQYYN